MSEDAAIIYIATAAVVIAAVALISLVASKEANVVAMRRAWMDDLRADVAQFLSAALVLSRRSEAASHGAEGDAFTRLQDAGARLRLRLDPRDRRERFVSEMVERGMRLAAESAAFDREELANIRARLMSETHEQLLAERKSLIRGGPAFQATVTAAAITVGLLFFLGFMILLGTVV